MKQAGIDPAAFRFVAQHLNHCATAVPNRNEYQEYYVCGVKRPVCRAENLSTSMCGLPWNLGNPTNPGTLRAFPGLSRDRFTCHMYFQYRNSVDPRLIGPNPMTQQNLRFACCRKFLLQRYQLHITALRWICLHFFTSPILQVYSDCCALWSDAVGTGTYL